MRNWMATRSNFFREWVRAPLRTASVIPSSKALARKMANSVTVDDSPVIELGPGTGVFTHALLERGVPEENLVLVEINPVFVHRLRKLFPAATVLHCAAEELSSMGIERHARYVVSGIPLMSTSNSRVSKILESVLSVMEPDGNLVQFTYAPRCPVNRELMEHYNLRSQLKDVVFSNFPPAHIYHIRRA